MVGGIEMHFGFRDAAESTARPAHLYVAFDWTASAL